MKKLITCSEIVESIHGDGGEWEVCAAAEADYDESNSRVVVELESFLRKVSVSGDGEVRRLPWLPTKNRVTEHAPREEASQVVHDVFASWVRKVRQSIPAEPLKSSA
jgi:hypothetical protein